MLANGYTHTSVTARSALARKSRQFEDAIRVLEREIARCENHTEYVERAKVEGYSRARQLLLLERKKAPGG